MEFTPPSSTTAKALRPIVASSIFAPDTPPRRMPPMTPTTLAMIHDTA
jgi:hypothetical protein